MGPFDGLISSNIARHRIKLITSNGLEKLLVNELSSLSKDCEMIASGSCYVEAKVDLHNLWKIMLGSRVCDQLWMHVCEPFPVRTVRTFMRTVNHAEWKGFIPFSANLPMPHVKVNTKDSSLYHTGMVKKLVHQVIKAHCNKSLQLQGDELPSILKRRGHLPICPSLMVNIDSDMCEVLANTSGDLSERPWSAMSTVNARIRPSMVSAIVNKLDLLSCICEGRISTILDPLCHIGTVLLEIYSLLLGLRLRPLEHEYPLNNFPLNCKTIADDVTSSWCENLPSGIKLRLIGTDVFQKHVQEASSTYEKYKEYLRRQPSLSVDRGNSEAIVSDSTSSVTTVSGDHSVSMPNDVTLSFTSTPLSDLSLDYSNVLILSNLYYGDKGNRQEFLEAHRKFETFLMSSPCSLLQNVYVIATENFRKNSRFTWQPELRFNNGGVIVMLLKLCKLKNAKEN